MRVAVLGVSQEAAELIEAMVQDDRFQIEDIFLDDADSGDSPAAERIRAATGLPVSSDWRRLLNASVDRVLVSGGADPETRAGQLRNLLQGDFPLWLVHPACESIVAYELDMTLQEGRHSIDVYAPWTTHPAVADLREIVGQGEVSPIGAVETIRMERRTSRRGAAEMRMLFAQDALLLSLIAGEIQSVQGVGRGEGDGPRVLVSASMQCPQQLVVQWSQAPGEDAAVITLIGERGRADLRASDAALWTLTIDSGRESQPGSPEVREYPAWSAARQALDTACGQRDVSAEQRLWRTSLRSLEASELAQQSTIRGRALPLYRDQVTEADAFKGVMASWGCGLLLLTLFVLLGYSMIEGVRFPAARARWAREQQQRVRDGVPPAATDTETGRWPLWLRLWPVYPFALFLLLQFLRLICRDDRAAEAKRDEAPAADRTG